MTYWKYCNKWHFKDRTKDILKYYNKKDFVEHTIFKAFISGRYDSYDLELKTNNYDEIVDKFNFNFKTIYEILEDKKNGFKNELYLQVNGSNITLSKELEKREN